MTTPDWLPHDEAHSAAQLEWLLKACDGQRVVDLGCGDGRVAVPVSRVARSTHLVDLDRDALDRCVSDCSGEVVAHHEGMSSMTLATGSFDRVLCLGNTFALLWDVDQAVAALKHWRTLLAPGGFIVLDDMASVLWPEVAQGHWCSGLDEDATMQMVWAPDDAVFTIRAGASVDAECWTFKPDDRRMRLWTAGSLKLAALAAGCGTPAPLGDAPLVTISPDA